MNAIAPLPLLSRIAGSTGPAVAPPSALSRMAGATVQAVTPLSALSRHVAANVRALAPVAALSRAAGARLHALAPAGSRAAPLSGERLAGARLARTPRIGPVTFHEMLGHYGSAKAALEALPSLARRAGFTQAPVPPSVETLLREAAALARRGGRFIVHGDPDYPAALAQIADAPPLLAAIGEIGLLARPGLAVVGARNASTNGKRLAAALAGELGAAGLVIVSGLARGIDAAAHRAALETGTIAVLAGGIDVIYPPENEALYRDIAAGGLLLSEAPLGAVPQARHFPRRNRIVSGLSRGVLVVEAALQSGSLITARQAADQGREVFAVPGSPLDPRCRGGNRLIRDGAQLVEDAADVLAHVRPTAHDNRIAPAPCPAGPAADEADNIAGVPAKSRIAPAATAPRLAGPAATAGDDIADAATMFQTPPAAPAPRRARLAATAGDDIADAATMLQTPPAAPAPRRARLAANEPVPAADVSSLLRAASAPTARRHLHEPPASPDGDRSPWSPDVDLPPEPPCGVAAPGSPCPATSPGSPQRDAAPSNGQPGGSHAGSARTSQSRPQFIEKTHNSLSDRILGGLGRSPTPVDELIRECHVSAALVTAALLELELSGRVERLQGNMVALI